MLLQVLCCSPLDSNTVLTSSFDGTVHLIDLRQPPPPLAPWPANARIVPQMLGGGPVDENLSSSSSSRRALLNMHHEVYAVDWNRATGTEFVAASGLGDLRIFDIRKGDGQDAGSFKLAFRGEDDSEATGCAWSKDGRRLVGTWLGGRPYTFDVEAGVTQSSCEGRLAAALNAGSASVFSVTPAQRSLRIVSDFKLLRFWSSISLNAWSGL
jgi:WD40 repeat protein